MITKDEMIAEQAIKITELEKEIASYKRSLKDVYNVLYCIGGPLNDNKLKYSNVQLRNFFLIAECIDAI